MSHFSIVFELKHWKEVLGGNAAGLVKQQSAAVASDCRFGVGRATPHHVEPKAVKELGMFLSFIYLKQNSNFAALCSQTTYNTSLCLRGSMTENLSPPVLTCSSARQV